MTPPGKINKLGNDNQPPVATVAKTTGHDSSWRNFSGFILYVFSRYTHDRMQQRAASLTFTTLLAIVPLLTVSFAIFSAFPAFQRIKVEIQDFIFSNFIPEVGGSVQEHFETFTQQTSGLTGIGVIFLIITSVMLLMTISGTFNDVWRVRKNRPIIMQLMVFWAVLTLAPLFFGASLTISSYLFAVLRTSGVEEYTGSISRLALILPFLLQSIGLTILFVAVPNFPVRRRDALMGGIVAGILLEVLKSGFGFYITNFPTYETIYGAMATIPIFLIWVYLSWIVVLLAAEMTASLPEWRAGSREASSKRAVPTVRLTAALSILYQLQLARHNGGGVKDRDLSVTSRLAPKELGEAVQKLSKAKFITKSENQAWLISRDLSEVTLRDLLKVLELDLNDKIPAQLHKMNWAGPLVKSIHKLDDASESIINISLDEFLAASDKDVTLQAQLDEEYTRQTDIDQKTFFKRILILIGLGGIGAAS